MGIGASVESDSTAASSVIATATPPPPPITERKAAAPETTTAVIPTTPGAFRRAIGSLSVPLAAFVAALMLFGVFIALTGRNPFAVYYQMYRGSFGTWFSFQNTLLR